MTKLQELTEKICELLKDSELDPIHYDTDNLNHGPIREAEILMSLSMGYKDECYPEIFMTAKGEIGCSEEHWVDGGTLGNWHLGKPLSEQSEETINFLHEILVR